jgi:hypothetical protein
MQPIPGYDYGTPRAARSPVAVAELAARTILSQRHECTEKSIELRGKWRKMLERVKGIEPSS